MSNNLVPQVLLSETTSGLGVPQGNQVVIGIIGTSEKGTTNTVTTLYSVADAETTFGSNTSYGASLVSMIRKAFQEGASIIKAISIGTPTMDAATTGANTTKATLTTNAVAGALSITVTDGTAFATGKVIYIGTGSTYAKEEMRVVTTVSTNVVNFATPLKFDHYIGETAKAVTAKLPADYTTAITALTADEGKTVVVSEANDATSAAAIATMCDNSALLYNTPCVYIRGPESADTEGTVVTSATTTNSKRVINVFPALVDFLGKNMTGGETAACVAGAIANNNVPKLNHNFTAFATAGGVASAITNIDTLISGGVTPIELKYGTVHIVRFVTTYTKKDGVPDTTWREAAVRLNVDHIQRTLSRAIQTKFLQSGNTPQVRLAIAAELTSLLNNFASSQILVADERTSTPAFRAPVVTVDATDSTKVNVDIEISPGKPLNFISLNFKVIV